MKNIVRVFRYEFLRNLRRPGYLFTTFGVPVLFILFSQVFGGSLFTANTSNVNAQVMSEMMNLRLDEPVGYVDHSGMFKTPLQERENGISPDMIVRFESLDSALTAMRAGEIASVFEFPATYAEDGEMTVHVERMAISPASSDPVYELIYNEALTVVDIDTLTRLRDPGTYADINLSRLNTEDGALGRSEDENFWVIYGYAILFMITSFASVGYLMQSVIEEKQSRLIEVLLASIRPVQLLAGKIVANGALGLMQIFIWIGFGVAAMSLTPGVFDFITALLRSFSLTPMTIAVLAVYFVLGYLMFAAIFGGVGAISVSVREGPQFASMAIVPAMIPLFIIMVFAEAPNSPLPTALSLIPFMSPLAMPMRLLMTDVPSWQIAVSIGLQAVLVLVLFWMAGRLFRVQSLLSGEVPTLNQMRKMLFSRA